jgi:hypothetical protein
VINFVRDFNLSTMVKRTPWLKRKFNFDFPVTNLAVILERLRGTPPRIADMVNNIAEEILSGKNGSSWSVKEHIGHLTDLEELHEKRLTEFLAGKDKLSPADMTNEKTYTANHNTRPVKQLVEELKNARNTFVKKIEPLSEEQLSRVALHPRLQKPMRLVDMVFFVAEHDDQHIAIMRELLNNR